MNKTLTLNLKQWQEINGWLEEYKEELYENYKASEDEQYEETNIEVEKFIDKINAKFNTGKEEVVFDHEEASNIVEWLNDFAGELYENYKATDDEDILKENEEVNKTTNKIFNQIKQSKTIKK